MGDDTPDSVSMSPTRFRVLERPTRLSPPDRALRRTGSRALCENRAQLLHGRRMRKLPKTLILVTLTVCAGCAKPSDVSVARRDHILAGPHGWIDITLHAPAPASAPAGTAPLPTACAMAFAVNGEVQVLENADLAQADAARNPLGYRFVVPAGSLNTELAISHCVKDELHLPLAVAMAKDHLASLEFDGRRVGLASNEAYAPTTLDAVSADLARLHDHGDATDGSLSTLTKVAIASLVLNVVVLLGLAVVLLRRRSR